MNGSELETLSIHHIGDDPKDSARVALNPGSIKMVSSRDVRKNDRDLKLTVIHFADGESVCFTISGLELEILEKVIAGYSFD